MSTTAGLVTTVQLEKRTQVRVNVAEEGLGMAHLSIAADGLSMGLYLSGEHLAALISDLQTVQERAQAVERGASLEGLPTLPKHPERLAAVLNRVGVVA